MLELRHYSTMVGENFEYCTSQMPRNASGRGNYYIFKFQICLPPKLNLRISFPSQKLSSPGKINNQFPPPRQIRSKISIPPQRFGEEWHYAKRNQYWSCLIIFQIWVLLLIKELLIKKKSCILKVRSWSLFILLFRQRLHGVGLRFRFGAKSRYELKYFAFTWTISVRSEIAHISLRTQILDLPRAMIIYCYGNAWRPLTGVGRW